MTQTRKKILFMAEAVTLAHVGRMLTLAESLDPARYQVLLAADPRYAKVIGNPAVEMTTIQTVSSQHFFAALDGGKPIYNKQILIDYADEDLRLIDSFKPDAVVGDFRLSLAASARRAKVPYINVTNAYWSPYAKIRYIVPEIPLTRIVGVSVAQWLFNLAQPIAFALHAQPVNAMLKHFGLPTVARDLRHAYTAGDWTCYADSPELVPMHPLPANHRFIGPIHWSAPIPRPDWWEQIPQDKPVVYANLGSSGHGHLLPIVLAALADQPISVIAATAGRVHIASHADNIFLSEFINAEDACKRADLIICNGGSPSCYLALEHGKPSLSLPVNLDQYLNAELFGNAGVGRMLRSGRLTRNQIGDSVAHMLEQVALQQKTTMLSDKVRTEHLRAGAVFHRILDEQIF